MAELPTAPYDRSSILRAPTNECVSNNYIMLNPMDFKLWIVSPSIVTRR